MHEKGLTEGLIHKVCALAEREGATKVVKVSVQLGALSHMSPSHFKDHFTLASLGTIAEHAVVEAEESTDIHDPNASFVTLKAIEVQ